jgi:colanic acid biosynthesis glycosyl transferase WcaI
VRHETLAGVPVTRLRHYVPRNPTSIQRLLSEISFGFRLLAARWGDPDVVVLVSPALFSTALAMLRARLSRRRPTVIVWVQDLYSLGVAETGAGGGGVAGAMSWVESATLNAASGVIVIHSRFARYVTEVLGVKADRVEVVRNWAHLGTLPKMDVAAERVRLGWGIDETIVLHAGNMGAKQGLENVVKAARVADERQLPLRFVLLGDGNQRKMLLEAGNGVERLDFLDPLDDQGFQAALAAADILLVNEKPGVSEMSVPSKLTSYFNAGKPVLAATDPLGVTAAEVVASGGGVIVSSGDPSALVDAAENLRRDPVRRQALGASGLRYRRDLLEESAAIDRYLSWMRKIATRHGR